MATDSAVYAIAKVLESGADVRKDSGKIQRTIVSGFRKMIQTGPRSGHLYTVRFFTTKTGVVVPYGERPPHLASAPGEPPANDSGALFRSIGVTPAHGPSSSSYLVTVGAKHGRYLEYGTRKMRPRPFFRPRMTIFRSELRDITRDSIERRERTRAIRLGGRG